MGVVLKTHEPEEPVSPVTPISRYNPHVVRDELIQYIVVHGRKDPSSEIVRAFMLYAYRERKPPPFFLTKVQIACRHITVRPVTHNDELVVTIQFRAARNKRSKALRFGYPCR